MSLRILQLGPYPPPEGGISRNMLAIRDEISRRGHTCSIVATSRSTQPTDHGDVYHPRSPVALLRLLSCLEYDILHLHVGGDVSVRVLTLAAACSFFGRNKSILTLHSGAYPLSPRAGMASPNTIPGRIFRRFSRIVAVNEVIGDVFRRYGVPSERLRIILPYSLRLPDDDVSVPRELEDFSGRHSPMLLSVGGLERDYDPLFLIAAMKGVLAEFPNAGLMIVGGGAMRVEVEKAVGASGYASSIRIAGNIEHSVTLHLIEDADIVLRTTLFDGDAISVREAMFLGTPVIATRVDGRPEGVHLIGVGRTDELVNKVTEITRAAGDHGREGALPDDENIKAIVDLYEELAAPH